MNNFDKVYFKSKVVDKLSSQSLIEMKSTLQDIESGKKKLKVEMASATKVIKSVES